MPIGPFRTSTVPVNVRDLERFDDGADVTPEAFQSYSSTYSCRRVVHGSFPGLRIGMNPAPRMRATQLPKMNPRDSMPTTRSTPVSLTCSAIRSITSRKAAGSRRSVVMS